MPGSFNVKSFSWFMHCLAEAETLNSGPDYPDLDTNFRPLRTGMPWVPELCWGFLQCSTICV